VVRNDFESCIRCNVGALPPGRLTTSPFSPDRLNRFSSQTPVRSFYCNRTINACPVTGVGNGLPSIGVSAPVVASNA
jgi:hypothetical protein